MNWEKMADDYRRRVIGEGVFSDDFEELENIGLVPELTEYHVNSVLGNFFSTFSKLWENGKHEKNDEFWEGLSQVIDIYYEEFHQKCNSVTGLQMKVVSDQLISAVTAKDATESYEAFKEAKKGYEKVKNRIRNYVAMRAEAKESKARNSGGAGSS